MRSSPKNKSTPYRPTFMNDQLAHKFEEQDQRTEVQLPNEIVQKLQNNATYQRIKDNFNDPKFRGSRMLLPHIIETILLPTFDAFALLPPDSREITYMTLWIIDGVPDPEDEQMKTLPSPEEIAIRLSKIVLNTINEWKQLEFSEKLKLEPTVIPFVADHHKEMDFRHGKSVTDTGEIIEAKHDTHHMPLREDVEKARLKVIGQISAKIKSEYDKLAEQTNPENTEIGRTISGFRKKTEGVTSPGTVA